MKISSKTPNIEIKSTNPSFSYKFTEANEPIEVRDEHAEKILKNSNFYEHGKAKAVSKKQTQKVK